MERPIRIYVETSVISAYHFAPKSMMSATRLFFEKAAEEGYELHTSEVTCRRPESPLLQWGDEWALGLNLGVSFSMVVWGSWWRLVETCRGRTCSLLRMARPFGSSPTAVLGSGMRLTMRGGRHTSIIGDSHSTQNTYTRSMLP